MKSEQRERRKIVVVGAGIAGLTAAYELRRRGQEVTVLEVEDRPGGRMADWNDRSFRHKYTGATGLFAFNHDMWKLIDEFDLRGEITQYPAMGSGIGDNGRETYDLDFNKTIGMLWHKGLSFASKLRLPSLLPDLMRARRSVDPNFIHTAAEFDDESMAEYIERKVGRDFLENIIGVVYRNLWTWNVEQASRAYFLLIYPHVRGRPSYTFKNGMGTLSRALASRVDMRYGCRTTKITLGSDTIGRTVHYVDKDGPKTIDADIVICAVRGDQVNDLVENKADWESRFFADVPYAQYAMIHYMLSKDPSEEFDIRTFFTRNHKNPLSFVKTYKKNPADPTSQARLWAVFGPERFPHYIHPDGSNLDAVARHYVRKVYPPLDTDVTEVHEMYDKYVIAMFPAGQARKVRSFLSTQEAGPKNIYYVGDYLSNATTGGACAIGKRTALQILDHWR